MAGSVRRILVTMPRLLLAIPIVLVCIGCGSSPRPYGYEVGCIHIESEVELNADTLAGNVALAREILAPLIGASEFCPLLQGTPVVVRAEPWFKDVRGEFIVLENTIYLVPRFHAFAHEALHVWETRHWTINPAHTDWDKNGFGEADKSFTSASVNPF